MNTDLQTKFHVLIALSPSIVPRKVVLGFAVANADDSGWLVSATHVLAIVARLGKYHIIAWRVASYSVGTVRAIRAI